MTEKEFIVSEFKKLGIIDENGTFNFPLYQKTSLYPSFVEKASAYGIIPSIVSEELPELPEVIEIPEQETPEEPIIPIKNEELELFLTKNSSKKNKKKKK